MNTFDLSFDRTFRAVNISPSNPSVDGCRKKGAYLAWLTLDGGPMYWLFEGQITKERAVSSRGNPVMQAGAYTYPQKEAGDVLTIRTANLSEAETEAVATIYEAAKPYLLVVDDQNVFHQVPVSIEPGTFGIKTPGQRLGKLDVRINLPTRRGHRA